MPVIQPDTSQMTDFKASQPGKYRALIKAVAVVKSKEPNKKTGQHTNGIQPDLEFTAPRLSDQESRTVVRRPWLPTDGSGTMQFDQLLRCVGLHETADAMKANPGGVAFDTDELVGKYVDVLVVTGQYQPKAGGTPVDQDDIESFLPAS